MKLLELHVEGYRSLKNITWTPGDLNVLIGPNGSGKTNLAKVLELLTICAKGSLGDHVQREGGMRAMSWDGQGGFINLQIRTSLPAPSDPFEKMRRFADSSDKRESLFYEITLGWPIWDTKDPSALALSLYTIRKEQLTNKYAADIDLETEIETVLQRDSSHALILDAGTREMVDAQKDIAHREPLLSLSRPPFPLNPQIAEFQQTLASWTIYEELWAKVYSARGRSPFSAESSVRWPSVARYETSVSPDGSNLVSFLHTLYSNDKNFETQINEAMSAAFGEDFERLSFPPAGDQLIQLRIRWKSLKREVSAADLSDGTLRFLFLVAVLTNPDPPPLIVIEEPEIGLHPSMLPIIAEYAVEAATRTQVIFTTHSPDFLSAFRETAPTTTVFNWQHGETSLRVLSGADLDYWLKEYSLGELFRSGQLESME